VDGTAAAATVDVAAVNACFIASVTQEEIARALREIAAGLELRRENCYRIAA
jgi:hypothetical protein